jgi:hypothetical protein
MVEHGDLSQTQASSSAQTDHVAECITAITDYRSNQISKWGAITQISAAISSAAARGTYLVMLDEQDWILASTHVHGRWGADRYDSDNGEPDEDLTGENRLLSHSASLSSK